MSQVRTQTGTIAELLLCLGGPLIWATQFFVLYGAATLACLNTSERHSTLFFSFALAVTLVSAVVVLGLALWQAARTGRQSTADGQADGRHFLRVISIVLALGALLAIVWGALPVLMITSCGAAAP